MAADLTAGSPTWLSIAGWLRPPHPSARDEPNAHHDEDTGDDEEPADAAHGSNEPERAEEREHPGDLPDVVASDGRVMRAAAGSTEPQHRNRCHPEEEASHGEGWPALGSEPKRIKHRIRAPLRRPTSSRARNENALASIEAQVPRCSSKSTVDPGLLADWGWLVGFPIHLDHTDWLVTTGSVTQDRAAHHPVEQPLDGTTISRLGGDDDRLDLGPDRVVREPGV